MKIWIVFHTFDNGHQIVPFSTKRKADNFANKILKEYSEEYKEEVTVVNLPELNDHCNLEIVEEELK